MALSHVVGRDDVPVEDDEHAGPPCAGVGRQPQRGAQVSRAVPARVARVAHRPGHDDRPLIEVAQIPGEGRLLEGVRALHDNCAGNLRIFERRVDGGSDGEDVREGEVAGRRPPAVDRDDLGDRVEAGHPREQVRAGERRQWRLPQARRRSC